MIYYDIEKKENEIWLLQREYNPWFHLKTESAFAQSNGYFGVRAAGGLPSLTGKRGMFVAGLFNCAYEEEVTELVNCPDVTQFRLILDGEEISPDGSKVKQYERKFNIHTGELVISIVFELQSGGEIKVVERRFASMDNRHLFAQCITVSVLTGKGVSGKLITGINGQQTNSGVSHFQKVDCRVYDREIMHTKGYLKEDSLSILEANACDAKTPVFTLKRRGVDAAYAVMVPEGENWTFEKYVYIHKWEDTTKLDEQKAILKDCIHKTYDRVLSVHKEKMLRLWQQAAIRIDGATLEEEASIAFAQYHLLGMMPWNSSSSSIAAKGLTGEGYKGHVFWDTEIFMLPFFQYHFPEAARQLLEFRYRGLEGAKEKAADYGYAGAMYPWEAAASGKEETPLYAALNIHTGKANKVWSGIKEHHVTADIVYAIWQYYSMTGDNTFMDKYGYEMIFQSADFWVSRAEWDEKKQAYVILDIIGPDEYTEHIDNNAYSNYMARYCVALAAMLAGKVKVENPNLYSRLNAEEKRKSWEEFAEKIYLPVPNEEQIIPQDDTFLTKKCLQDIEKYKKAETKQAVLQDYSRDEVVDMQVLKQADTVMLLNLFPQMFSPEVVRKNVLFYESRTIHDSSLSYCAHAQACASVGAMDLAWEFFEKCMVIDLDENPNDTTDGIHAASLGGIWTCVVFGFAGVNYEGEVLHISPRMPAHWKTMNFHIKVKGQNIQLTLSNTEVRLENTGINKEDIIKVEIGGEVYRLKDSLQVIIAERKEGRRA
ncbi:MAG: glycosyl hydrolase family 65 protein [Lachnospiraceae bacterium]|nr:glycosyl hydrolase family 65 protein [Lachnospiraceae bacterium]